MEKNNEIQTVHSPTRRFNKKLLIVYGVVVVVLIACAAYATVTYMNKDADKDKKAAAKPKLVAPAKVVSSLQAVDSANKAAYNQHVTARAAFDEKPVKLVK